jgi:hypothetical protein
VPVDRHRAPRPAGHPVFSFTSFVTTKIIKVLYVPILILVVISALAYPCLAVSIHGG